MFIKKGVIAVSLLLCGIASAHASAFAYIVNKLSNNLSVVNTSTNLTVATVPLDFSPFGGIAVKPDGSRVYVADSQNLSVINAFTNTIVAQVPVGGPDTFALGVAMAPNGNRVYVGNTDDMVVVIDTATNTRITTVPVVAESLVVTPNGAKIYAVSSASSFISVIDTASNTRVAMIPLMNDRQNPLNVAITPDSRWVYVTIENEDDPATNTPLAIIDTATDTLVGTVTAGGTPFGVAVTPNGQQVYVTNLFSNDMSIINVATNTVIDTVPAGFSPVGVDFTADGARAYIVNGGGSLSIIDTATRTVVATVPIDGSRPGSFGKFIGPNLTAGNLQFSRPVYTFSESGRLNRDGELVHSGRVIITRGGGKQGPVSVLVSTGNGTALAGSDYVHQSRRITFADGDNSPKYFIFPIIADTAPEFREALRVVLRNPTGGVTLGGIRTVTVRITNDDG